MKDFFKPEDFVTCGRIYQDCADVANEKLNALIESWPVVYNYNEGLSSWWNPKEMVTTADNPVRQARLAFIEEIVKEPCSHKPVCTFVSATEKSEKGLVPTKFICDLCGVELQATWSEKK